MLAAMAQPRAALVPLPSVHQAMLKTTARSTTTGNLGITAAHPAGEPNRNVAASDQKISAFNPKNHLKIFPMAAIQLEINPFYEGAQDRPWLDKYVGPGSYWPVIFKRRRILISSTEGGWGQSLNAARRR